MTRQPSLQQKATDSQHAKYYIYNMHILKATITSTQLQQIHNILGTFEYLYIYIYIYIYSEDLRQLLYI